MSTPRDIKLLAAIFAVSGTIHLARPEIYEPIMPETVPAHREVIIASGAAELALAAGLLSRRTRRVAGWGSVALLLGVFPANVKMAADTRRSRNQALRIGSLLRLPLQWPLVRIAFRAARGR